uniref:Uncharacterized protein n=1 Tax=Micrurus spixii TaxID=129469 RepID=A0A2D4MZH3_9SAUR
MDLQAPFPRQKAGGPLEPPPTPIRPASESSRVVCVCVCVCVFFFLMLSCVNRGWACWPVAASPHGRTLWQGMRVRGPLRGRARIIQTPHCGVPGGRRSYKRKREVEDWATHTHTHTL